jgi:hypothetical protein
MAEENNSVFSEMWAMVELMGHVKMAGRISEESHFGTVLLRCDVPNGDGYFTQFYGGSAIYRITPISEEVARAFAARSQPEPVRPYELMLPAPSNGYEDIEEGYDPDGLGF